MVGVIVAADSIPSILLRPFMGQLEDEWSRKEPAHARSAMRLSRSLSTKWTHLLAFAVLVSGFLIMWVHGYGILATARLFASVVLFLASFLYASLIQNRDLARLLDIIEKGLPDTLTAADRTESLKPRMRIRYGGIFIRGIVVIVLFLMILKPL